MPGILKLGIVGLPNPRKGPLMTDCYYLDDIKMPVFVGRGGRPHGRINSPPRGKYGTSEDGKLIPSVTEILDDVGLRPDVLEIPHDRLVAKGKLGTCVHSVLEKRVKGHRCSVPSKARPYVESAMLHELLPHIEVIQCEGKLFSNNGGRPFAGTVDLHFLCTTSFDWLDIHFVEGEQIALDWKTRDLHPHDDLQVSGYCDLIYATTGTNIFTCFRAFAVGLQKTGDPADIREVKRLPKMVSNFRKAVDIWYLRPELGL